MRAGASANRRARAWAATVFDALVALLLAGLLAMHARDLDAPFDRQFDGFQGAFFALAAIGYERPGAEAAWPYPLVHVDGDIEHGLLYTNHPPLVPLLAHAALRVCAPRGWDRAWREGRAPKRIESALRAPFALLHAGAALVLGAALFLGGNRRAGLVAAVLFLALPVSQVYGALVNYENPGLFAIAWIVAVFVGTARLGRASVLGLVAAFVAGALAGATTYAPVIFLAPLGVWLAMRMRLRAVSTLVAATAGAALALGAHAWSSRVVLERLGGSAPSIGERARELVGPLLDGSLPFASWLAVQVRVMADYLGPLPLALSIAAILAAALAPSARTARDVPTPPIEVSAVPLGIALLVGGALVQLAFYRHTGDPQEPFLLWWVPGIAVTAAATIERVFALRRPWIAGALLAAVVLLSIAAASGLARPWRDATPERPSPKQLGEDLARIVPRGSVAWYPEALAFTPAVAFYAWRNLVPVAPPDYAMPVVRAASAGLGGARVYVLQPDEEVLAITPTAALATRRLLADLAAQRPESRPIDESRWFRLWTLR